jgi:AraC-like DNA-binding protein
METHLAGSSKQLIQEFFDTTSELFHIKVSLVQQDSKELLSSDSTCSADNRYCSSICGLLDLETNCRQQKETIFAKAHLSKDPQQYTCHGGLHHIVYTLHHDNVFYGFIHVSNMRITTDPPASIQHLWNKSYSAERLKRQFLEIPYFRTHDIANLTRLITCVSNIFFCSSSLHYSKPESLEDLLLYMKEHLDIAFSLAEASAFLHKSESRISHLFLDTYGKSFKQIQAEIKIHAAYEILHDHPAIQVKELAEKLGFRDSLYFSKFFRKHTGRTVSDYKKTLNCTPPPEFEPTMLKL